MALQKYTGQTNYVSQLDNRPNADGGLTADQLKAVFDQFGTEFVEWFNETHLTDIPKILPNRNLLHNWDFRNPVNQRGQTTYTTTSTSDIYTIDRWKLSVQDAGQQAALTINDGHITLSSANSRVILRQITEITVKEDTVFTFSANITEISGAASMRLRDTTFAGHAENNNISAPGLYSITGTVPAGKTIMLQMNTNASGQSFSISKAKLERGSVSTLANDPPADYGEELRKCQRYFRLWTTEAARTEALKDVGLMRLASPTLGTISISGTTYYYASAEL